jgi:hypothetical protein
MGWAEGRWQLHIIFPLGFRLHETIHFAVYLVTSLYVLLAVDHSDFRKYIP